MPDVACVSGDYRAKLGESPLWDPSTNSLVFVDIQTSEVCRLDVASAAVSTRQLPHGASCVVKSAKGGYLVATGVDDTRTGGRMVRVDFARDAGDGAGDVVGDVYDAAGEHAGHVTNDGAVDPMGRVWIGTKMPRPRPAYVMDAEAVRSRATRPTSRRRRCIAWKRRGSTARMV